MSTSSKYQYIACDAEKCVGCQLCEYACSYTKNGDFNAYRSRIRTVRVDEVLITAIACRTCENAACVVACTRDALIQDPETGVIHLDAHRCNGCAWCIEACEFGAITINPRTKLAEFCNQCEEIEGGPQCVKWCPKKALVLTTPEQRAQRMRRKVVIETGVVGR